MKDSTTPQPAAIPVEPLSTADNYVLSSGALTASRDLRLDAAYYNPKLLDAIHVLQNSGMKVECLANITDNVFIPPRFKRVYVENPEHGVPFLQGSHIVHFQPADIKYLSSSQHNLKYWIVRAGWILMTCSGTIGRTTVCPDEWDGWAASQHILRIVPNESKCPAGYLCSFLASPLGQVQLAANSYGAVVDELTKEQASSILVPIPKTDEDMALVLSLDNAMRNSIAKRSEAASIVNKSIVNVHPPLMKQQTDGFLLSARHLDGDNLRFDAGNFNPNLLNVLDVLNGVKTVALGEIANVLMPTRFKRVYVEPGQGQPFLQGSHIIHFQATGLKYLSRGYEGINDLIVKKGWLLVTCSGTVGRTVICPIEWDGWLATPDLIRVVPNDKRCPAGYLCSFLSSSLGQIQLTSRVHGAVVDHLTEEHVRNIRVALPDAKTIRKIDSMMKKGVAMKSQAVSFAEKNIERLVERFAKRKNKKPSR